MREPASPQPPPVPAMPNRVTIAAGTLVPIRLRDGLSSERNLQGDTFTATQSSLFPRRYETLMTPRTAMYTGP